MNIFYPYPWRFYFILQMLFKFTNGFLKFVNIFEIHKNLKSLNVLNYFAIFFSGMSVLILSCRTHDPTRHLPVGSTSRKNFGALLGLSILWSLVIVRIHMWLHAQIVFVTCYTCTTAQWNTATPTNLPASFLDFWIFKIVATMFCYNVLASVKTNGGN